MALNSQFIASILSARTENSFSLANANVDFALVRVEVPKRFEGLGNALSQHRRQNAECGPQHRIARRLGALFEQIIPNIDILTAAYVHPVQVEHVMAMATKNSIYTSEALLQDPALQDRSGEPGFKGIRRIHGNLGYPGVVMLIPPPVPRILQANSMRGRFVQAASFDGQPKNTFTQTSLHLKLTDYKIPLTNARGAVDADVVMREALISTYDGSGWVADLDIIRALQSQQLTRFFSCTCVRDDADNKTLCQLLVEKFGNQLKVITSWEELLLCQENLMAGEFGTVLVYGSWFARLAVTTLAAQMKYPAIALPSHCVCFQYRQKILDRASWASPKKSSTSPLLFII